jgi:hypothetical protein
MVIQILTVKTIRRVTTGSGRNRPRMQHIFARSVKTQRYLVQINCFFCSPSRDPPRPCTYRGALTDHARRVRLAKYLPKSNACRNTMQQFDCLSIVHRSSENIVFTRLFPLASFVQNGENGCIDLARRTCGGFRVVEELRTESRRPCRRARRQRRRAQAASPVARDLGSRIRSGFLPDRSRRRPGQRCRGCRALSAGS